MAREIEPTPQQRELMDFLIKATKEGYAAGKGHIIHREDGSHSTMFKDGNYEIEDNWEGGEPFSGWERVRRNGAPVFWSMVYFGIDETHDEGTIPTLRAALKVPPPEMPVRGPREFENGDFRYVNNWKGTIDAFEGSEAIYFKEARVYNCSYRGGLVNQQK